jgi:hypothetical protein
MRTAASPLSVFLGTNLGYRFYARNLKRFYTCDWPTVRDRPSRRAGTTRRLASRPPEGRQPAGEMV